MKLTVIYLRFKADRITDIAQIHCEELKSIQLQADATIESLKDLVSYLLPKETHDIKLYFVGESNGFKELTDLKEVEEGSNVYLISTFISSAINGKSSKYEPVKDEQHNVKVEIVGIQNVVSMKEKKKDNAVIPAFEISSSSSDSSPDKTSYSA